MMTDAGSRILCPVDFSDHSRQALRAALDLASAFGEGAAVTVLYVDTFEPPPYFTSSQTKKLAEGIERSRKAAKRKVEKFYAPVAKEGETFTVTVKEGTPARVILETAKSAGARLVVMGSHGRTGISRFMMGSVTERVLAETEIPVLTARGAGNDFDSYRPKRVICPVDFSETARLALVEAALLAGKFGAELTAVHVAGKGGTADAKEKLCAFVPSGTATSCALNTVVKSGHTAEEIISIAGEGPDSLIVLGAKRKTLGDVTVFGQTVVSVTRHAKCPVLVIPYDE